MTARCVISESAHSACRCFLDIHRGAMYKAAMYGTHRAPIAGRTGPWTSARTSSPRRPRRWCWPSSARVRATATRSSSGWRSSPAGSCSGRTACCTRSSIAWSATPWSRPSGASPSPAGGGSTTGSPTRARRAGESAAAVADRQQGTPRDVVQVVPARAAGS